MNLPEKREGRAKGCVGGGKGEVIMKDGEWDRFEDRREDINKEIKRGWGLQETAIREEVILHSQLSDVGTGRYYDCGR